MADHSPAANSCRTAMLAALSSDYLKCSACLLQHGTILKKGHTLMSSDRMTDVPKALHQMIRLSTSMHLTCSLISQSYLADCRLTVDSKEGGRLLPCCPACACMHVERHEAKPKSQHAARCILRCHTHKPLLRENNIPAADL